MPIIIEIKVNRFPQIAAGMEERAAEAVAKAVFDAEAAARTNAPVDTGNLRNSITGEADGLEGFVYTNVEYAPFQEFGTYKMPPHPFLVPAIESVALQFQNDMKDIFGG